VKLYLDMCVYNRPFDEQSQPRIVIETQIFVVLLLMVSQGRLELINSFALAYENSRNPKVENGRKISDFLKYATEYVPFDEEIVDRALGYEKMGIDGMDALHVACAEKTKADFFVSCDDKLLKKLQRIRDLGVACASLIDFASQEVFKK
jgi:predicted nucleic acid-binding protein